MTPMTMNTRVDADGMLRVILPIGISEADQEGRITVESASPKRSMTQAEWATWVQSMAGSWQGDFDRPPQGELQERDPL